MTARNIQTREGYDYWDKLCAIPYFGFIHSPDNSRILKAEGIGNWIDRDEAQRVVDDAQSEVNELRVEVERLTLVTTEQRQIIEGLTGGMDSTTALLRIGRLEAEVEVLRPQADALHKIGHALGLPAGSDVARYALPSVEALFKPVNRTVIRDVFLRNGFTIKEGQSDLKQYVYEAAEELLALDGRAAMAAKERV